MKPITGYMAWWVLPIALGCFFSACTRPEPIHREVTKEVIVNNRWVPGNPPAGEILVKFDTTMDRNAILELQGKFGLVAIRVMPELNLYQMKITDGRRVEDILESLESYPGVIYAEPNRVRKIE